MTFLLDTNIISEWRKPHRDPGVVAWLQAVDEDTTFMSVVTVAELTQGVVRLPAGKRKDDLSTWLSDTLEHRFDGRILAIDIQTAITWANIVSRARSLGRGIEPMDAFIAATAERYDLTLVTRNFADFDFLGVRVFNPWRQA